MFDASVDPRYFREASLTAGKFQAPVSLEKLQNASALTFTERALPIQHVPNREVGFRLHGESDPLRGPAFDGGAGVYEAKGKPTPSVADRENEKVFISRMQVSF